MRVRKIHCTNSYHFFRYWLEVLCLKVSNESAGSGNVKFPNGRQHHILTSKQMDLLAVIMRNRWQLEIEGKVKDDDLLDQLATNERGRGKIRAELGIMPQRMYELLKGIESMPERILVKVPFDNGKLDYYRINPKYMPVIAKKNEKGIITDLVIRFIDENSKVS